MEGLLNAYADHALWAWVGLGAALLAAEVATGSGWLLWPAAAAGVTAVAARAAELPLAGAATVFAGLTIASTLLARRYLPRSFQHRGHDINDNAARLVGQVGRAAGPFRAGWGRVLVDGKEWPAALEGGGELEAGAAVAVSAVEGNSLRVRPA